MVIVDEVDKVDKVGGSEDASKETSGIVERGAGGAGGAGEEAGDGSTLTAREEHQEPLLSRFLLVRSNSAAWRFLLCIVTLSDHHSYHFSHFSHLEKEGGRR